MNKGFIKIVLLVIVAILILSYFGVDIRGFLDSPKVKENFFYAWNFLVDIWNDYIVNALKKVVEIVFSVIKKAPEVSQ